LNREGAKEAKEDAKNTRDESDPPLDRHHALIRFSNPRISFASSFVLVAPSRFQLLG
jgi:hypothetical protein